MPFVSTKDNGGIPDPNVNRSGRPKSGGKKKLSRRGMRDQELLQLTRKFRPHVSAAIMSAVNIMQKADAADSSKLKAAALIINEYHKLIVETYEGDDVEGEDAQEIQPQSDNRPLFSLKIIGEE